MRKYTIAVDIGGTSTKIAVVKGCAIKEKVSFPTQLCKNKKELIEFISFQVKILLDRLSIKKSEIFGMGIGLPGLIDYDKGMVHYLVNIPGWKNVPLKKLMERSLGMEVFIDNDVNVMALAELHYGNARGSQDVICITLGTGVGGGIVIAGRLYRGNAFSAGEIGHVTINPDGPLCNCGNRGCIETFVGNKYLIRNVKDKLKKKKNKIIDKLTEGNLNRLTPEVLTKAASMGDKFSRDIWGDAGKKLGIVIADIVNILNPDKIVIGGGVANAGGFLFAPLLKTVKSRAMKIPANHVRIVKSRLGDNAGLIGAATLFMVSKGLVKK